jgi:hypothetical protein
MTVSDDGVSEYRAIRAAFLARDIGECLRILGVRLERFRVELERNIRCDEFTRSRLLI